jgi:hypothetical protein
MDIKVLSNTARTSVADSKFIPIPQICGSGVGYPRISMELPQSSHIPLITMTTQLGTRT